MKCCFCGRAIPKNARPRFFRQDDGNKPVHAKCERYLLNPESVEHKIPVGRSR